MSVADSLPTLNAFLNFTSAALLVTGRQFIKRGNRNVHKKFMISAFSVSVLFLISYLTYHGIHGTVSFQGTGPIRILYLTILSSHTLLAAVVPFLAVITLRRGLKDQRTRHAAIARWTFPIWLYVSVTGVIVYLLLYHL